MNRRHFLATISTIAVLTVLSKGGYAMGFFGGKGQAKNEFNVMKSDAEWKEILSEEQYRVLRKHGTERAGSSALDKEKRQGVFNCAACDHPLFSSEAKYDSGTGWPSFYQPINDKAIGTSRDYKLIVPRTEVHCANCGGHLGHVFNDGPAPTGLRYCMNGVALSFKPN